MSNEKNKIELIKKINELAQICSLNGMIGDDDQSLFIGETIKLVLLAASDEDHARLLQKHLFQFMAEAQVLMGKKTLNEYLCFGLETGAN